MMCGKPLDNLKHAIIEKQNIYHLGTIAEG